MRTFGWIAVFVLSQCILFGAVLAFYDRLPSRSLRYVMDEIQGRPLPTPTFPAAEEAPKKAEAPASFDEQMADFLTKSRQLQRQKEELDSYMKLAESKKAGLAAETKRLADLRKQLESAVQDRQAKAALAGEQRVLDLVQAVKPKQAKDFLLACDEPVALGILSRLEPDIAGKVLKEFKETKETTKLHLWLTKLHQGEPAKATATAIANQISKPGEPAPSPSPLPKVSTPP